MLSRTLRPIFLLLILVVSAPFESAADNYLKNQVQPEDLVYYELYVQSINSPHKVDASKIQFYDGMSMEARALMSFALLNLQRFEGQNHSHNIDIDLLAEYNESSWVSTEAKLHQAIHMIESDQIWQGETLLEEVITQSQEMGYMLLASRAYRWLGNAELQRTNLTNGMKHYQQALKILSEAESPFQVALTLSNIATVYMQSEEWPTALEYIEQSLDIYNQNRLQNTHLKAVIFSNFSTIYYALGDKEKTQEYMFRSMEMAKLTGANRLKVTTLSNFSLLMTEVGNHEEAIHLAEQCMTFANEEYQKLSQTLCNRAFASAYLAQDKFDLSIEYSLAILETWEDSQSQDAIWILDTLEVLILAHEGKEDFESAFNYLRRKSEEVQKLYKETYTDDLLFEKSRLERELNRQSVALLRTENELQAIQLESQVARELFYLFAGIVIAYLAYTKWRHIVERNRELETENAIDPLTRLYNRRYLEQWLTLNKKATASDGQYALVIIDIDHFKHVNDRYGHDVGDEVLTHLSKSLNTATRSGDVVLRWGGEEFVLLLRVNNQQQTKDILERLRIQVESSPVSLPDYDIRITISMGAVIAQSKQQLKNEWSALFNQADRALYLAKQQGRNCCVLEPNE